MDPHEHWDAKDERNDYEEWELLDDVRALVDNIKLVEGVSSRVGVGLVFLASTALALLWVTRGQPLTDNIVLDGVILVTITGILYCSYWPFKWLGAWLSSGALARQDQALVEYEEKDPRTRRALEYICKNDGEEAKLTIAGYFRRQRNWPGFHR